MSAHLWNMSCAMSYTHRVHALDHRALDCLITAALRRALPGSRSTTRPRLSCLTGCSLRTACLWTASLMPPARTAADTPTMVGAKNTPCAINTPTYRVLKYI